MYVCARVRRTCVCENENKHVVCDHIIKLLVCFVFVSQACRRGCTALVQAREMTQTCFVGEMVTNLKMCVSLLWCQYFRSYEENCGEK